MRDQPTGDQLLETARAALRDELLPALPPDKRHAALMIANAMAIASRQLKNGEEHERQELTNLERILSLPSADAPNNAFALREQLASGNRRLCQWIREGRADPGDMYATVRDHLLAVTRRKVDESNPKYRGASN